MNNGIDAHKSTSRHRLARRPVQIRTAATQDNHLVAIGLGHLDQPAADITRCAGDQKARHYSAKATRAPALSNWKSTRLRSDSASHTAACLSGGQ